MTSTAGSYDNGEGRSVIHKAGLLIGHYSSHINIYLMAFLSARAAAGIWYHPDGNLSRAIHSASTILALAVLAASLCGERIHKQNLCMRDLHAAPILDPQGAIDKNMRRLRLIHTRRSAIYLMAAALAFLTLVFIADKARAWPLGAKAGTTAVMLMMGALVSYIDLARITHQRLQHWCPLCRRGPGNNDEVTPAPTPDPVGAKTN